jgi:leader peptidase (prepilin peptidase) / N-methyltransferase
VCLVLFRRKQRSVINESAKHRAGWRHDVGALFALALSLCLLTLTSQDPPIATLVVLGICSATMAVQTVIDVATKRLPLLISLSAACLMLLAGGVLTQSGSELLAMASGGISMMAIAQLFVTASRGSLGRGDVYVCLPLGIALGAGSTMPATLMLSLYTWMLTALAGGVAACLGLFFRRLSKQSTIPYGPFLAVGTIAMLVIRGTP